MAVVTLGNLTDANKTLYVRKALEIARPRLVYAQFGQKDRLPAREGNQVQWIRFTKIGLTSGSSFSDIEWNATGTHYVKNTTGAPPTWTPLTPTDVTVPATMDFLFGPPIEVVEAKIYSSFLDLLKEFRTMIAQQAGEVIDTEVRDVVVAGTTVGFANGKASRGLLTSADKIDTDDVLDNVVTLRNNSAVPPANGSFAIIVSPNVEAQLMKDSAFRDAVQFQKEDMFVGTIATYLGCKFFRTERAPTVANSGSNNAVANIEQTLIVGSNSYGITHVLTDNFDVIYTAPGGHGDEWASKHKLTWKASFKSVILNQNWILRLESAR
jgi:hypothetical protein